MCYKIDFLESFSIVVLNNSLQIGTAIQLLEHLITIGFHADFVGSDVALVLLMIDC